MMLEGVILMKVTLRKFSAYDIPNKVRWINDEKNNEFLHYDLPLEIEKTENWFQNTKDRKDRYDAVIEVDGIPVGLIGLLSISQITRGAEYYITMGEQNFKGKGIAFEASKLILQYAFNKLHLNQVYLYTEVKNYKAQHLFEKLGFIKSNNVNSDLIYNNLAVDRFVYTINKYDFLCKKDKTPIQELGLFRANNLFIKREDLIPYSFGGNKARKAALFFEQIDQGNYDYIVTYGSSHSNHCRIVANMSAQRKLPCLIISPNEADDETYNKRLMDVLGAEIITVPVNQVSEKIEHILLELEQKGFHPYFIAGGGHGNIGTQAYVNCYDEIAAYEKENKVKIDYVFFATGTGTTHAGLVCGQFLNKDLEKKIVGISIARRNPYGRNVVINSIKDYLLELNVDYSIDEIDSQVVFVDEYIGNGYGQENVDIMNVINNVFVQYGIPLDSTYTAKAFNGMEKYIEKEQICNKNILFIHTGGTPLFFDDVRRL